MFPFHTFYIETVYLPNNLTDRINAKANYIHNFEEMKNTFQSITEKNMQSIHNA